MSNEVPPVKAGLSKTQIGAFIGIVYAVVVAVAKLFFDIDVTPFAL